MKTRIWLAVAVMLGMGSLCAAQTAPADTEPVQNLRTIDAESQLSVELGYRHLDVGNHTFTFLPNPGVAGSTATRIGKNLNVMALGLRDDIHLSNHWDINIDGGGLLGYNKVDVSDTGSSGDGDTSAVYWGGYAGVGLSYFVNHDFYVGGEAQVNVPYIVNSVRADGGLNPPGQYLVVPSIGPKIGWEIEDNFGAEATMQFGKFMSYGMNVTFHF